MKKIESNEEVQKQKLKLIFEQNIEKIKEIEKIQENINIQKQLLNSWYENVEKMKNDINNSRKENATTIDNLCNQYSLEDKEFKKGISIYKDYAYKYGYSPTPAKKGSRTSMQMFLDGDVAMHLSGRWVVPKYRECANFNWDVVNFPNCMASSDASGWAISKNSKNKNEAIKFIQFLSTQTNIEKMTQSGLIIPARKDTAKAFLINKRPEHSELFLHAVINSENTRVDKNYTKNIDKLNDKYFYE